MPSSQTSTLRGTARQFDRLALAAGKLAALLCLAMGVATGLVVILRYGMNTGSVALQESVTYLHAGIFMLGAALTLQRGAHVRVDIFYRRWSSRTRAWIDACGAIIFLLPLCIFMGWISWDYVQRSWEVAESSADPGGLPAVYLLKTLIPIMAATLFVQGCAELLRHVATLIAGETETDSPGASGL